MGDPLLRRRVAAAVGSYASVALGFLATIVAARIFTTAGFGLYALVIASTGFFQSLLDLTIEEALIKYGFRYVTRDDWGRLRRLFERTLVFKVIGALLGGLALVAMALYSDRIYHHGGLQTPLLIAALLPLAQAPEGMAATQLMLRGRYDVRAAFLALSMALRLAAVAAGAPFGLTWAIAAIVVAQVVATAAIWAAGHHAFTRFPRTEPEPLGGDAREILRFIAKSSGATGVVSFRRTLAPMLLGIVSTIPQVAYFRAAQAPQQGFDAASSPIRMVLLTEQTRDWERGAWETVLRGVRRYTALAFLGSLVLVPVLLVFMGPIVRLLFEAKNSGAIGPARIIVIAGAVLFVVGWSKSFAVTIGRPDLRIWTHGIETLVLLPLVLALGSLWGAMGAAYAVLAGSVAFSVAWLVLFGRISRRARAGAEPLPDPAERRGLSELGAAP